MLQISVCGQKLTQTSKQYIYLLTVLEFNLILSRVLVTTDGVRIDE
jgi:hypothetical protein